jgi:hypothetical protein
MSLKSLADYDRVPNGKIRKRTGIDYNDLHRSLFKEAKKRKATLRGRCDTCSTIIRIKGDGKNYKHSYNGTVCGGSGEAPLNILVACPNCARHTAYNPLTKKINIHNVPLGGLTDFGRCDASGDKVAFMDGKAYLVA